MAVRASCVSNEAARKRRPRNRPSHANGCAQVLWSKELIERELAPKKLSLYEKGSVWVESIESHKSKTKPVIIVFITPIRQPELRKKKVRCDELSPSEQRRTR